MLKNIRSAVRNSLIYGLGNLSVKLVGLILIPIYTDPKYLSINDYGVLGVVEATSQVIIAILGLALAQALTRWYWDQSFSDKQKSMFFTLLTFLLGFSFLLFICFYPFSGQLSILLFEKADFSRLLRLMFISACLQMLSQVPLTLLKLQEKPGLYSGSNVFKLFVTLILTIYLVVFEKRGLEGIYEAQIIGGIFIYIFLIKYILRNIRLRFEVLILRNMLIYSFPLVLGSVSGVLLSIFDRYTLNFMADLPDVGVYTLGYKVANTIKILVITSVQLAISPMIFKMMNQPESKRFYSKIMTYFSYLVIFLVLGMSFFAREIIKVFTSSIDYWDASKIIPVISFALFFGMLKDTSLIGLQITKRTKIIGIVIFFVAILNLGLNIILIPKFKIMGAAVATLLSQIIFFIVIFINAQKHYFIPYEISKVVLMVLVGLVLFCISLLTNNMILLPRLVIKTIILLSFPFILYPFKFYEPVELERIKGAWDKWKNPLNWRDNIKGMKF